MDEQSIVKIWEICATDAKAGVWIFRNLNASQAVRLAMMIDEQLAYLDDDCPDGKIIREELEKLAAQIDAISKFYSDFPLAEISHDVKGYDLMKSYQEIGEQLRKQIDVIVKVRGRISTFAGEREDQSKINAEVIQVARGALNVARHDILELDARHHPDYRFREEVAQ